MRPDLRPSPVGCGPPRRRPLVTFLRLVPARLGTNGAAPGRPANPSPALRILSFPAASPEGASTAGALVARRPGSARAVAVSSIWPTRRKSDPGGRPGRSACISRPSESGAHFRRHPIPLGHLVFSKHVLMVVKLCLDWHDLVLQESAADVFHDPLIG